MFYRDAIRGFDALIGEVDAAGDKQRKTGWMRQAWHRRLTWLRWLRELKDYAEGRETMALAYHVEAERLTEALKQILWSTRDQCEHYTSGIGSCFRNALVPDAHYGAEQCCNSCIAHRALNPIGYHGNQPLSEASGSAQSAAQKDNPLASPQPQGWQPEWPTESGWFWFYGVTHKCLTKPSMEVVRVRRVENPPQPAWCAYIVNGASMYQSEGAAGLWLPMPLPLPPQEPT